MIELLILLLLLVCAIVAAAIATSRGETLAAGLMLGGLLGPLGIIVALASGKQCPYCRKRIAEAASICPYCRSTFASGDHATVSENLKRHSNLG